MEKMIYHRDKPFLLRIGQFMNLCAIAFMFIEPFDFAKWLVIGFATIGIILYGIGNARYNTIYFIGKDKLYIQEGGEIEVVNFDEIERTEYDGDLFIHLKNGKQILINNIEEEKINQITQ